MKINADTNGMLCGKTTGEIIGAFYDVYNELRWGFLEKVYTSSLAIEFQRRDLMRPQGARSGTLYTIGADGKLVAHRVMIGVSDGQKSEIKTRDLKEGDSIVVGANVGTAPAPAGAATNPLQGNQQQQRRGPGGF